MKGKEIGNVSIKIHEGGKRGVLAANDVPKEVGEVSNLVRPLMGAD